MPAERESYTAHACEQRGGVRERAETLGLPCSRDHRTMPNRRLAEDLLRDAECSKVVAGAESQLRDDREIWIIRVPRDVSFHFLLNATSQK